MSKTSKFTGVIDVSIWGMSKIIGHGCKYTYAFSTLMETLSPDKILTEHQKLFTGQTIRGKTVKENSLEQISLNNKN